jgi:hypothetical protein
MATICLIDNGIRAQMLILRKPQRFTPFDRFSLPMSSSGYYDVSSAVLWALLLLPHILYRFKAETSQCVSLDSYGSPHGVSRPFACRIMIAREHERYGVCGCY